MRGIASGISERLAVRDEAALHIGLFRRLVRFADQQRELRRDFDLFWIAAIRFGKPVEFLDALGNFVKRSPAREPAAADLRRALDRGHVVAADVERERVLLRLRRHLEVGERVIFARERRGLFADETLKGGETLFQHLTTVRLWISVARPRLEFLAISAKAHGENEAPICHLVDGGDLFGQIHRFAHRHD